MPNYRRLFIPGGTYFLTLNLRNRRRGILVDHIAALRASWRDVQRRHPFETLAAVVLPDHMHFIWALPLGDDDYPTRVRLLKSGFTRRLPETLKRRGRKGERNIWQRRYWEHCVRDEKDLSRHIDYIHWNPVKHGHAADPGDWPHSTWHDWKKEYGRPVEAPPEDWSTGHLGEYEG